MKLGPNKDISLKVLKEGDGETRPTATSVVIVDYTGYLSDGSKFDTSVVCMQFIVRAFSNFYFIFLII